MLTPTLEFQDILYYLYNMMIIIFLCKASDFNGEEAAAESDLIVADIPEGQKPLICVEYPGWCSWRRMIASELATYNRKFLLYMCFGNLDS